MDSDFDIRMENLRIASEKIPRIVGVLALDFSKDRFRAQNWIDNNTEPWKKRKDPNKWGKLKNNRGRALLIKTGALRRSLRVESMSDQRVILASDSPYGAVHNEGFKGTVNQQVGAHSRTRNGRKYNVKSFNRTIHQNIPRRRFLGTSQFLTLKIEREITALFIKALK